MAPPLNLDVLCVGHASFDLVFGVSHHPGADEKMMANALLTCGGGPAANAAVQVARLGYRAGFAGHLGTDLWGDRHAMELLADGVDISLVTRSAAPTPLSAVLVKPDGRRALVNFKGDTRPLAAGAIDFSECRPKAVLLDGHEAEVSLHWIGRGTPTILDAGSLHSGTRALMFGVDYLVCSEKFAAQWLGEAAPDRALNALAECSPAVVLTLGEHGLIWKRGAESGRLPAYAVTAVDTTGAGDAFHGAFAAGLAADLGWEDVLRLASAAGALCCTVVGARPGIAERDAFDRLVTDAG